MERIKIEDYLKYLEMRWPKRSVQRLKTKLLAKGLIDCWCAKCSIEKA